MEPIIQVTGLSKSYSGKTIIRDISLSVPRGHVYGLLGANGAGKTTSIECILGTRQADGGTVSILGMNPRTDRKKLFEQVGVQFQECSYPDKIRVWELCLETACLYRNPLPYRQLLDQLGLSQQEHSFVADLSGGQRQRLFIVLALIPQPQVVFLDELTTGLDTKARRTVWNYLSQLKKQGITILLTSHFMDEVEVLCDEIGILRDGHFTYTGTVENALISSGRTTLEEAYLWYAGEEDTRS